MNVWVKGLLVVLLVGAVWFFAKPFFGFNDLFAVIVSVLVLLFFVFVDRVNWAMLFQKERDVLSVEEWRKRAVAALEKNFPLGLANRGYKFEAEIEYSVPIGVLWVFKPGPNFPECAFGEVWSDSVNPIVSPLKDLNAHLHDNSCKSIAEVGRVYLRDSGGLKVKEEK